MAILLQSEIKKMKFKNIFKNSHKMASENIENEQITEETNVDQSTENQGSVEEITLEEKLSQELVSEKDKYLRLFAEFENYKRRTSKERIELFKTANQDVLQSLLPIIDDFERAIIEIKKSDDNILLKGVELIYDKFNNTLASKGLELVDVKIGDPFNADFAEAITQIPAPSDKMKGKIIDVIERGYKLGDKIIRFPKVVVGN